MEDLYQNIQRINTDIYDKQRFDVVNEMLNM